MEDPDLKQWLSHYLEVLLSDNVKAVSYTHLILISLSLPDADALSRFLTLYTLLTVPVYLCSLRRAGQLRRAGDTAALTKTALWVKLAPVSYTHLRVESRPPEMPTTARSMPVLERPVSYTHLFCIGRGVPDDVVSQVQNPVDLSYTQVGGINQMTHR